MTDTKIKAIIDIATERTRYGGDSGGSHEWTEPLIGKVVITQAGINVYEHREYCEGISGYKEITKASSIYNDFVHAAFSKLLELLEGKK